MSVFVRRFLFDPGNEVLLNIESVNIIDLVPPSPIAGVGTGTVLLVGEFENGPFGVTTEVVNASDLANTFGSLGYTYGSVVANYPCAVARKVDGSVTPEYWNGNGFVALNGKQFARLLICRVDTSVGSVQFQRMAYLTGAAQPSYVLATGQQLTLNVNGGGDQTAVFTGTPATVAGVAAACSTWVAA
jgi:hypothetical protein